MGFASLKFNTADVVLDGGVNGSCPDSSMFFLNCEYIHYRPHKDRDMVPLDDRFATNQDALVKPIAFAGNLTTSNLRLQGRLTA